MQESTLSPDTNSDDSVGPDDPRPSTEIRPPPKRKETTSQISLTIDGYLERALITIPKPRSIFKVPRYLRKVHKNSFDPKLVSVGPYHHDVPSLQAMEEMKLWFFTRLVKNDESMTHELVSAMKDMEIETRRCYSESCNDITSHDFVLMMMRDGCFVVELLRLFAKSDQVDVEYADDPIFCTRWMVPNIQHDLFLLENQLPYNALKRIFDITSKDEELDIQELALNFFKPLMPSQWKKLDSYGSETPAHFLDLCRSRFISPSLRMKKSNSTASQGNRTKQRPQQQHLIHCASELNEAGIKFKKRDDTHDLLDIGFKKGVLEIPPLLIDVYTGTVFLNLVAYELCDVSKGLYFTDYLLFLDHLVNSAKDIEILHSHGIIDPGLGSDKEVAALINSLSKEAIKDVNNWYLSKEVIDINQYYNTPYNKWWAQLKHVYFNNPWTYFTFAAAVFLIALTIIQTFFSVYSYVRPAS